jgi:HPt (histidine-containing phosphotransfer) domain-containing protein
VRTDLNYLKTMSGDDPVLISEMIEIFSQQVIELQNEMEELLRKKDYTTLGKVAHKAKTSVAIMGMNNLASELKNLELNAKEMKNIESYEDCIENFRIETEEAVKELLEFKNELS